MAIFRIYVGVVTEGTSPDVLGGATYACYEHEECMADREMGMLCAKTRTKLITGAPLWSARYEGEQTDYSKPYGSPESKVTVTREATCFPTYEGRVVKLGVDMDVRVMSDVWDNVPYAIVWDYNDTFKKVSRYDGPGYDMDCHKRPYEPSDTVDAPAEIIARYEAEIKAKDEAAKLAREEADRKERLAREEAERKAPKKGRLVKVVRGRKVPKGTEGIVFWIGETRWGVRVGMKVPGSDEPIWIDAKNVEAIYPEPTSSAA